MNSIFPGGPVPRNTDRAETSLTKLLEIWLGAIDPSGALKVSSESLTFKNLSDTPQSYAGQAGKHVAVRSDELGVEFVTDTAGISLSEKGVALGVATLGADSKLTGSQVPSAFLGGMNYMGTWDASTNATSPAGALVSGSPAPKGQFWQVIVSGSTSLSGISDWKLGDWVVSNGTAGWGKVDNTDAVISVAGKIGIVTLVKGDVGLGNVDDTSDANKPTSSPQASSIATAKAAAISTASDDATSKATAAQAAAIAAGIAPQFNEQAGTTYTLVIGDAGRTVRCANAADIALTIPTNATVAFPIGAIIYLCQGAAGKITVGGAGVTIECASTSKRTTAPFAGATLQKRAADTWWLEGRLE